MRECPRGHPGRPVHATKQFSANQQKGLISLNSSSVTFDPPPQCNVSVKDSQGDVGQSVESGASPRPLGRPCPLVLSSEG